jgi:hypothetical protein
MSRKNDRRNPTKSNLATFGLLITPIMMIIASRRRAVRTKCIDRDNYVGHQKAILWPHACIAMSHKSGVVASAKSAIDGKFGRGASR